tara:strand:- start:39 stop:713 length:675 start_codon:yes stop_codon:yes gene_type:complete
MALKGKKPLETAMHKKRAEQTQNVKRLTTSDDAYSPERRVLQVEKKTPYGSTGTRKVITDWHNIKEEGKKLKEKFVKKHGRGTLSLYDPPKSRPRPGKQIGVTPEKKPLQQKILRRVKKEKKATGGRAGYQGGGRTNLFEELGRVEAEPSNRNRRAEISRVHGELNRGYKDGKRVGLKHGTRGPHGYGPKPFLNRPGQAQGTHGGKIAKASDKAIKGNKLTKKA